MRRPIRSFTCRVNRYHALHVHFPSFLAQSEIQRMDAAAYAWYMSDEGKTAVSKMWQAAHDWSISDALGDLAEGCALSDVSAFPSYTHAK